MSLVKNPMPCGTDVENAPDDTATLFVRLKGADHIDRREAAVALRTHPEASHELFRRLAIESDANVRAAIFDSLAAIGTGDVVNCLVPLLRSDDAEMRNGALEVLKTLPDLAGRHIDDLIQDRDPDVRILAVTLLRDLSHPRASGWLRKVLTEESHVNVCSAALDGVLETGGPELLPILDGVRRRFRNEPYILATVDLIEHLICIPESAK